MTDSLIHTHPSQAERLARFGLSESVDLHCHCLPGLDDGPATLQDAIALCRGLVEDGITAVIATPHQLGSFTDVTTRAAIADAAEVLRQTLATYAIPLKLAVGAELRIEEGMLDGVICGELLTLPDKTGCVLIELPHEALLDIRYLLEDLTGHGLTPILAHPERHEVLSRSPQLLMPWLEQGLRLQVTAASLLGDFGPMPEWAGWTLLESGWVSVIASDAHDAVYRRPSMSRAIDLIADRFGHAVARKLCVLHPQLVFEGRPLPRPIVRRLVRSRPG